MSNASVNSLGQIDAAGGSYANDNALFLKVFGGEVITAFGNKTVTMDKHVVRTITSGKAAQFPRTGRTTAGYHTPGTEILGDEIQHNEKIITIDDLLLTSVFISNLDEAKNHYDVRSIYSGEMGIALANQMDKHVFQTMIQAAQDTTPAVGSEADMVGEIIPTGVLGSGTEGDELIGHIFAAAEVLDSKNVPEEGRYVYVKPQEYYYLANASKAVNADFNMATPNGGVAVGKILRVAGIPIIKTNNLPQGEVTAGVEAGGTPARHAVDARNTLALVTHTSAVGTVKLVDLKVESEYDIRRQGTLMVAKYAVGHDTLRPEASVQLRTATPA